MVDGNTPESGQPKWTGPQTPPGVPQSQPHTSGQNVPQPPGGPQQPGQAPRTGNQAQQPPPMQGPPAQHTGAQPRQPQPGAPQPGQRPAAPPASAWWAQNAATDPWRNPRSSAVVQHSFAPQLPPTEPPMKPQRNIPQGMGRILTICIVVSLFTGLLGAFLGNVILSSANATSTMSDPAVDAPKGDYQEVISKVMPSVVTIWVKTKDGGGNGSGWVYSSDGYIVTNHHVAALAEDDSAEMTVEFSDGRQADAEVVGNAETTDIAVLKVDDVDVKPLGVKKSGNPAVGDPVIAMGAPLGLANTVTDGIVSAVDRPVAVDEDGETTVMAAVQTDAAINPGNSGGPLLNSSGEVIGVNTLIYGVSNQNGEAGSMGLGFAISSQQAARVAQEIIDDGKATRTVLGTELKETKMGKTGATVKDVESDTPADDAGLKEGDVITKLDDTSLTSDVQLEGIVLKHAPGDKVTVTYKRDDKESEEQVELGAAKDK